MMRLAVFGFSCLLILAGCSMGNAKYGNPTTPSPATAAPMFSLAAGSYNSVQTVSITDATAGAAIYVTANGTVPTASSTAYTGPIKVSSTETLMAVAIAPGYASSTVATAAYTITLVTSAPVFSPAAGSYNSVQAVSITDVTAGGGHLRHHEWYRSHGFLHSLCGAHQGELDRNLDGRGHSAGVCFEHRGHGSLYHHSCHFGARVLPGGWKLQFSASREHHRRNCGGGDLFHHEWYRSHGFLHCLYRPHHGELDRNVDGRGHRA